MTDYPGKKQQAQKGAEAIFTAIVSDPGTADATIILPGTTTPTQKRYKYALTGQQLTAGERCYVIPISGTYVLLGGAVAGGGTGEDGATFTPSVSAAGVISWTNDKGLPNPDPVNIKGPQGQTGGTGPQGPAGPGLPAGGAAGQIPVKASAADYDTAWEYPRYPRRNLLDNGYFVGGGSQLGNGVFPINQCGQTIYNAGSGFSLDRWTNAEQITLSSDYTEFINTNSTNRKFYNQYLNVSPSAIAGMTCTLSVLLDSNVLHTATGVVGAVGSGTRRPSIDIGSSFFAEQQADGKFRVCIAVATNTTLKVKAVKLELGAYQTLAHQENGVWVLNEIPNFGQEMLKCQRYLQVISSGTRFRPVNILSNRLDFNVALVVPMAGTPTLQMGSAQFLISAFAVGAQAEEGFTYSIGSVGSSIAVIRATKASHGLTDARLAVSGGDIFLAV